MKRLAMIFTAICLAVSAFGQSPCNVQDEYENIFNTRKIEYGERSFLHIMVNTVPENTCFAKLINDYGIYIDYMRTNYSSYANHKTLLAIEDSVARQKAYIRDLRNDSTFNAVMQTISLRINDPQHFVPDTVTMKDLMNIAVKFFSIQDITEEGYYVGKVCVGINGIKQTEQVRQPHIEGFCFAAILDNYEGEEFNLYDEFVTGIKTLYTINLGVTKEEQLLRAQGAMYMHMSANQQLRKLLQVEYQKKKDYLPFVLVEG